jgi:proteasome lid subunit RPN8/RPN11/ribosomal protein L37AE/L43A
MFYFSINKKALAKIRKEARSTDREIIGVLIGKVYDNLLVVTDAVSGEQASGMTRVRLDNMTLAKIVNKIMEGKIRGNILGWYHSHPGFGVFMSATDVGTQQMLQQFSSKVAALVIDPKEDHYEVFTLDKDNVVVTIPQDMIYKFKAGTDGIPPKLKEVHNFQAMMEVVPEHEVDKLRYHIELTTPYWPEKKCMICRTELTFDPLSRKWFCPNSDIVKRAEEDRKRQEETARAAKDAAAAKKARKKKKIKHKCAHCEKDLKFSPKLSAWYCKSCRRVYKHRAKEKDDDKASKKEEGKKDLKEAAVKEEGPDIGKEEALVEQKDVIVEAVEVMEEVTGDDETKSDNNEVTDESKVSPEKKGDLKVGKKGSDPEDKDNEKTQPTEDIKSDTGDLETDSPKKNAGKKKKSGKKIHKVKKSKKKK